MAKFKVSWRDSQILVKSKLDKSEMINYKDAEVFEKKVLHGLMRPNVKSSRVIEYTAPGNVELFLYLQSGLSKNDFFVVFAQFIECLKKLERNFLRAENLVLDTKYVFFNRVTKKVQFIYQPIYNNTQKVNVFIFMYKLIEQTVLKQGEDGAFLNNLFVYLRNLKVFSPAMLENYILSVYPEVYKKVKRSKTGDSQFLKNTGWNYYREKYKSSAPPGGQELSEQPTNLLTEEDYSNRYQTLIDYSESDTTVIADISDTDYEEPTGLLVEDSACEETEVSSENFEHGSISVNENVNTYFEEETGLLVGESSEEYDELGTTVLSENEGTTVLNTQMPEYPYLIRLNTYEKVNIDKPVFRIGKEKSYVDYFVMSNNAVSRIHADIIVKNGRYFVKDNNSTNHTFINGTMIPVNSETEIFDGDALMLANEPFEFHIS